MRSVFFAGAAAAVVFVVLNRAIALLNEPSDLAVGAGYLLLLALLAMAVEAASRIWRKS
jgi:hypothetical protein